MQPLHFVLPGDPATPTGGFVYDARLIAALRSRGVDVVEHSLMDEFPSPSDAALAHADRLLESLPDGASVVIDGLAFGAMPRIASRHGARLHLIALVHHPLADETGLTEAQAATFFRSERASLALAAQVVTTSRFVAGRLATYDVPADRIAIVPPGVDPAPLSIGSQTAAFDLLCVASLIPRKGHRELLEALSCLSGHPWRLTCVGSVDRDPDAATALLHLSDSLGIADRVTLTGTVGRERLATCYAQADLFVLASHYEGFGMVLREALACGLPVIATATGGACEALPAGAARLVPPGDSAALMRTLQSFMEEPEQRDALRQAALTARASLPTWERTAELFATAVGLTAYR